MALYPPGHQATMLRLLLCIFVGSAIGVTLLMIRQQRLELQYESNAIHDKMLQTQRQLWRQQVQIAAATAPAALENVLANHRLETGPVLAEHRVSDLPDDWDVFEREATGDTEALRGDAGWQVLTSVRE